MILQYAVREHKREKLHIRSELSAISSHSSAKYSTLYKLCEGGISHTVLQASVTAELVVMAPIAN
jgi:hypothetical protein